MEADKDNRPHNPNHHLHRPTTASCNSSSSTAGELLICFSTSRLSSSSMKISSSKSILSPGRRPSSRDQQHQASLSTSLSRRLRTNGSIKGGAGQASPMFPAAGGGGKKRGCGFDNPEPSSPKVTCIGQVRVKTKKQTKKLRARSLSRPPPATPGREGSFRRLERGISDGNAAAAAESVFHQQSEFSQQRNQRWVHLPLTICEALRTFGSEFNCFLPCRSSSCLAGGGESKEKEEGRTAVAVSRGNESNDGGSCGTVFARWLVAVQERDVKGREIELVAEEQAEVEEDEDEVYSSPEMRRRSYRRYHGFEKIDFDLKPEAFGGEESRMSSCIPPRNALLLMRCRSDPVKVAALGNKFWNPPDADEDDGRGGNHGEEDAAPPPHQEEEEAAAAEGGGFVNVAAEAVEMDETIVESDEQGTDSKSDEESMAEDSHLVQEESATDDEPALAQVSADGEEIPVPRLEVESVAMSTSDGETPIDESTYEDISDLEKPSAVDNDEEIMAVQANLTGGEGTLMAEDPDSESAAQQEVVTAQEPEPAVEGVESPHLAAAVEEDEEPGSKGSEPEDPKTEGPSPTGQKSKERENNKNNNNTPLLPDCLLLMMCEPKLSMEVSKETWVCSTDFIRWLPEPSRAVAVKKIKGGDSSSDNKKTVSVDVAVSEPVNKAEMRKSGSLKAQHHQPPRSSCSYPAAQPLAWRPGAESTGSGLEMKLKSRGSGKAYDYELPLMLKRCKSEPRNAAAKLAPEACCWKNRKLEPHRLGIGAAGVGF
ncbi:unnamed protein product [Linum tenue]|uniref:Uncharacterized protein n=1 Tax=Linum tenue TaxID=586396 RepID=A0AAV0S674_9ROSI|nr:unnamed protein product [Linum tenue]